MKKRSRILSLAFCVILLACPLSINASAQAAPYFKSDTNSTLTLANGVANYESNYDDLNGVTRNTTWKSYVLKVTTYNTNARPNVVSGNRKYLNVSFFKNSGHDYLYRLNATEKDISGCVGVYINIPGYAGKRVFIVNVETFAQLHPEPKYGTIKTYEQMPSHDFWLYDYISYVQETDKDGNWENNLYIHDFQNTGKINAYEDQLEKYYPNIYNTPLPTKKGKPDEIKVLGAIYVYLGDGKYDTTYK